MLKTLIKIKKIVIIIIVHSNGPATFHPVAGHEGQEGK